MIRHCNLESRKKVKERKFLVGSNNMKHRLPLILNNLSSFVKMYGKFSMHNHVKKKRSIKSPYLGKALAQVDEKSSEH